MKKSWQTSTKSMWCLLVQEILRVLRCMIFMIGTVALIYGVREHKDSDTMDQFAMLFLRVEDQWRSMALQYDSAVLSSLPSDRLMQMRSAGTRRTVLEFRQLDVSKNVIIISIGRYPVMEVNEHIEVVCERRLFRMNELSEFQRKLNYIRIPNESSSSADSFFFEHTEVNEAKHLCIQSMRLWQVILIGFE